MKLQGVILTMSSAGVVTRQRVLVESDTLEADVIEIGHKLQLNQSLEIAGKCIYPYGMDEKSWQVESYAKRAKHKVLTAFNEE